MGPNMARDRVCPCASARVSVRVHVRARGESVCVCPCAYSPTTWLNNACRVETLPNGTQ